MKPNKDVYLHVGNNPELEKPKKDGVEILADQINKAKPQHTSTPWTTKKSMGDDTAIIFGAKTLAGTEVIAGKITQANAAFIVQAVNAHEELLSAVKLSLTILNSIANELRSDFNLKHDNIASNACYIAAKCEKAIAKAEGK